MVSQLCGRDVLPRSPGPIRADLTSRQPNTDRWAHYVKLETAAIKTGGFEEEWSRNAGQDSRLSEVDAKINVSLKKHLVLVIRSVQYKGDF